MALSKEIVQPDGVVTNYHRILFIQSVINSHVSIAVLSYVNAESRSVESTEITDIQPYKASKTYEKEYVEDMTIESAYDYLKTLPEFEGAVDM